MRGAASAYVAARAARNGVTSGALPSDTIGACRQFSTPTPSTKPPHDAKTERVYDIKLDEAQELLRQRLGAHLANQPVVQQDLPEKKQHVEQTMEAATSSSSGPTSGHVTTGEHASTHGADAMGKGHESVTSQQQPTVVSRLLTYLFGTSTPAATTAVPTATSHHQSAAATPEVEPPSSAPYSETEPPSTLVQAAQLSQSEAAVAEVREAEALAGIVWGGTVRQQAPAGGSAAAQPLPAASAPSSAPPAMEPVVVPCAPPPPPAPAATPFWRLGNDAAEPVSQVPVQPMQAQVAQEGLPAAGYPLWSLAMKQGEIKVSDLQASHVAAAESSSEPAVPFWGRQVGNLNNLTGEAEAMHESSTSASVASTQVAPGGAVQADTVSAGLGQQAAAPEERYAGHKREDLLKRLEMLGGGGACKHTATPLDSLVSHLDGSTRSSSITVLEDSSQQPGNIRDTMASLSAVANSVPAPSKVPAASAEHRDFHAEDFSHKGPLVGNDMFVISNSGRSLGKRGRTHAAPVSSNSSTAFSDMLAAMYVIEMQSQQLGSHQFSRPEQPDLVIPAPAPKPAAPVVPDVAAAAPVFTLPAEAPFAAPAPITLAPPLELPTVAVQPLPVPEPAVIKDPFEAQKAELASLQAQAADLRKKLVAEASRMTSATVVQPSSADVAGQGVDVEATMSASMSRNHEIFALSGQLNKATNRMSELKDIIEVNACLGLVYAWQLSALMLPCMVRGAAADCPW